MLLQTMLLLDNRHEGREYKSISAATCLAYAESIRSTYNADKKEMLQSLVEYLDDTFLAKMKFLRKNNVPIVGLCAKIAQEQGVDSKDYKAFICEFSNNIYPHYEEVSGSGNVKAPKVQMRLRVMFLAMCEYFGWKAEDVRKPFAEDIPLYPDAAENSDLPDDAPTDGVSTEDAPHSEASEDENVQNGGDGDREGEAELGEDNADVDED